MILSMSKQPCKFCNKVFELPDKPDDNNPIMVRSVKTGDYICIKCFKERIQK